MTGRRVSLIIIILAILGAVYFVYNNQDSDSRFPFRYGLDLAGGTELIYEADTSNIQEGEVETSMQTLRDVIERRVNLFGVSEPVIQVEKASIFSGGGSDNRLVVELPGITDVNEAVRLIGETPTLEFKLLEEGAEDLGIENPEEVFKDTGLTGRFLQSAELQFASNHVTSVASEPIVVLHFNKEGQDLFASITRDNIGRILAIFLDGSVISTPVIRQEITGGDAQISGGFTPEEARDLARNLNFGALPVPINLVSTQSIGSTLGHDTLGSGIMAGIWGLGIVSLFLILWYRLSGVFAVLSLSFYVLIILMIFKLIPVVLTAAGIAGFILSIGMAVDANVLIFERIKEEVGGGRTVADSIKEGFARAWPSIRDANITSLLTAVILFWFGTSLIKGFALTFGLGVLISMFTAIVVTKTFMLTLKIEKPFWFKSGLSK
ncbi:MAG: protein translocase subunit SecD [Candidatus Pacebacteria bacterium]|nr:protein translocase subunit SecD [Candidatus Paceibacterota bacterium]